MSFEKQEGQVSRLVQDAIRADVHARVDVALGRLEIDVAGSHDLADLESALQAALTDVADVIAEGVVAQLREAQRQGREIT